MNSPARDIGDHMASLSSLALTLGTDLFENILPSTARGLVVLVRNTGGFDPDNILDRTALQHPTIQVKVMGAKGQHEAAYVQIKAVQEALHLMGEETINGTRYLTVWQMGDIFDLGLSEDERPQLTLNFRMKRTPA